MGPRLRGDGGECVASHRSFLEASVIAARKSLRVNGGFSEPPPTRKEGGGTPKGAPWVTAAAYFPDRRQTEAHGNASRRSVTAISVPGTGSSERGREQARHPGRFPHPSPVSSSQLRQRPVVGTDGYPRPPECPEGRPLHARRRRSHPHVPKHPR